MAVYYLDTSALVKRYVLERGTLFIKHLTDVHGSNDSWIASIGFVELVAALCRRVNTGLLTATSARYAEQAFRGDLHRIFHSVHLTPSILARAAGLTKLHSLRAYDAVQLATVTELQVRAKKLNVSLPVFLSADHALNQAALAEGLLVDDPNRYP